MECVDVEVNNCIAEPDILSSIEVSGSTDAEVEVSHRVDVCAEVQEWTLCNDNIYILKYGEDVPQWLNDLVMGIVTDPNSLIVKEIQDLYNLINGLEEGFNEDIYSLHMKDYSQDIHFESLKSSYEDTAAAVVRIDETYASEDYARATSWEMIGAYINGGYAGAWFEQSVSAVADVAYSAARSSSSLNASMVLLGNEYTQIAGDVDTIKKQIDGEIVTWFIADTDYGDGNYFNSIGPVLGDGSVNPDCKPYWCWVPGNKCDETVYNDDDTSDTRARHTGDTFIWYKMVDGNKEIISTWRFGTDPDTGEYNWFIFTDDLASMAYETALNAQETADGKITTYYGPENPELTEGVIPGMGDLWFDSDGHYDANNPDNSQEPWDNADILMRYDGSNWYPVTDARITASVKRLDDATVDINGTATAKGSLLVSATGSTGVTAVSGYTATATSGPNEPPSSEFRIFADKFVLASSELQNPNYAPMTVTTVDGKSAIRFNGVVEFSNILNPPDDVNTDEFVTYQNLATTNNKTIISGGNILTGTVNAQTLVANSLWTNGKIQSGSYGWPNGVLKGFALFSGVAGDTGWTGSNSHNIYGGKMYATTLDAVTINTGTLNADVINSGDLTNCIRETDGGIYVSNSRGTGTNLVFTLDIHYDAGTIYLYRGSTRICTAVRGTTDLGYSYQISYIDAPYNTSYWVRTSNGTTVTVGRFSAVLYKK